MKRKEFIKNMASVPLLSYTMKVSALEHYVKHYSETPLMPVLFLGHGSPMNAIEENEFVLGFRDVVKTIPKPNAILCVSAHWETKGTYVTAMSMPKTIHDFGGFPKALYDVQYPAPGSPQFANTLQNSISKTNIRLDYDWGLDHGAWSVIKHLYPKANIPVIQLSLDINKPAQYHYELAQELKFLRKQGVLIIGSGNMVHNLRMVDWKNINKPNHGFDWALEAREKMSRYILNNTHDLLINYQAQGDAFRKAIPTPEHYLPLLYSLALHEKNESIKLFNDKAIGGSLTMTSVKIG